jgi:hypothetical protein
MLPSVIGGPRLVGVQQGSRSPQCAVIDASTPEHKTHAVAVAAADKVIAVVFILGPMRTAEHRAAVRRETRLDNAGWRTGPLRQWPLNRGRRVESAGKFGFDAMPPRQRFADAMFGSRDRTKCQSIL